MQHFFDFPCWYGAVTFVFVVFHVGRGMIAQGKNAEGLKPWKAIWLIYAPDALLHLCCTVFGFVCLLFAFRLVEGPGSTSELSGLVFLALAGLAGITGQLAVALTLGKVPTAS